MRMKFEIRWILRANGPGTYTKILQQWKHYVDPITFEISEEMQWVDVPLIKEDEVTD